MNNYFLEEQIQTEKRMLVNRKLNWKIENLLDKDIVHATLNGSNCEPRSVTNYKSTN